MITIIGRVVLRDARSRIEGQVHLDVNQREFRIELLDRWDGRHWRWWALAAGIGVVAVTALIALPVSLLFNRGFIGLLMLGLVIELLTISFIGAGMLDSLNRKMNQGGLARDANVIETDPELDAEQKKRMLASQQEQYDRRTLRAGIGVLPILFAFFYLLFTR